MKYSEVLARLQNLTGLIPSQSQLCDITGVKQSAMSNRAKENSAFKQSDIQKLNDFYGINLYTNTLENNHKNIKNDVCIAQSDKVLIDYYPEVCGSCGNGVFQFSTRKEQITIPRNAFWGHLSKSKEYFVINAYGNSMEPFICDKDKLIIETWQGEQIVDNKAYLFAYKDELFIKRLAKNVDQLMIIPENKDYDIRKLEGEQLKDVNIIGQVVGLMRSMN